MRRYLSRVYWSLKSRLADRRRMSLRLAQSYWHGLDLSCVQDNTASVKQGDVLLFTALRNEAVRLPFFFEYYRKLGVSHFFIVDNGSEDDFSALVEGRTDVSVWYTKKSYRRANYGMHWLNFLLRRYGCGHWCVTCDPDEFLVYPHSDSRNLNELGEFLESEGRCSLFSVMLDMYSDRPIHDSVYRAGDDPFVAAPFFDATGYVQEIGWLGETWVTGGVRRRVFFHDMPNMAPALNKTPFVKWRWSYSYYLSMHQLLPTWLNQAHRQESNSVTGALMHFKYFSLLTAKVAEEMHRKQHWDDSFEYRTYEKHLGPEKGALIYEKSVRYSSWQQLMELGLLNMGRWF